MRNEKKVVERDFYVVCDELVSMYGIINDVLRKKDVSDSDVFVLKRKIIDFDMRFKFILFENEEMYNDLIKYNSKIVNLEEDI